MSSAIRLGVVVLRYGMFLATRNGRMMRKWNGTGLNFHDSPVNIRDSGSLMLPMPRTNIAGSRFSASMSSRSPTNPYRRSTRPSDSGR